MTNKPSAETAQAAINSNAQNVPTLQPSPYISHSAVFLNDLNIRLSSFDAGITTINAKMQGRKDEYERDQANDAALVADLEKARTVAVAALDALSNADGVQGQRDSAGEISA